MRKLLNTIHNKITTHKFLLLIMAKIKDFTKLTDSQQFRSAMTAMLPTSRHFLISLLLLENGKSTSVLTLRIRTHFTVECRFFTEVQKLGPRKMISRL